MEYIMEYKVLVKYKNEFIKIFWDTVYYLSDVFNNIIINNSYCSLQIYIVHFYSANLNILRILA